MKEYLRRAAWWAAELNSDRWPFFDIVALVDPRVRADRRVVEAVRAAIPGWVFRPAVQTCEWALHFAALGERVTLPDLPHPFEPLILMFERGNAFTFDGAGFIEVDGIGVRRGTMGDHLVAEPYVPLDTDALDAMDHGR
ncbi:hypothetical protein [Thermomonospora amylolytica]|uniref:hypothetical protein n=1 Tax=Thermomonospora amylolytica TaxID=1411117 RepID=UPI000E6CF5CD|nr:hypothetical protein [Thermomonospora amylolytica]